MSRYVHSIKYFLPLSNVPIEVDYIVTDGDTIDLQDIWLYNESKGSYDVPAESYIKPWVFNSIEEKLNVSHHQEKE